MDGSSVSKYELGLSPIRTLGRVEENGQAVHVSQELLQRYYSVEKNPEAAPAALQIESETSLVYAVAVKHAPVRKIKKIDLSNNHIKVNAVPDTTRIPNWICWQDRSSKWVYSGYEVADLAFVGDPDENEKTELFGVTIVKNYVLGCRKGQILRAVDGGYETVGSMTLFREQAVFVESGKGESLRWNDTSYWPWMTTRTVRWL